MNLKNQFAVMATLYALSGMGSVKRKIKPAPEPWGAEHLSKAERKGKSYEEIQKMRKAKWEARNV